MTERSFCPDQTGRSTNSFTCRKSFLPSTIHLQPSTFRPASGRAETRHLNTSDGASCERSPWPAREMVEAGKDLPTVHVMRQGVSNVFRSSLYLFHQDLASHVLDLIRQSRYQGKNQGSASPEAGVDVKQAGLIPFGCMWQPGIDFSRCRAQGEAREETFRRHGVPPRAQSMT